MIEYQEFLKKKVRLAQNNGFEIEMDEINPALKLHNKLMVKWMVNGGRRACFASFGYLFIHCKNLLMSPQQINDLELRHIQLKGKNKKVLHCAI